MVFAFLFFDPFSLHSFSLFLVFQSIILLSKKQEEGELRGGNNTHKISTKLPSQVTNNLLLYAESIHIITTLLGHDHFCYHCVVPITQAFFNIISLSPLLQYAMFSSRSAARTRGGDRKILSIAFAFLTAAVTMSTVAPSASVIINNSTTVATLAPASVSPFIGSKNYDLVLEAGLGGRVTVCGLPLVATLRTLARAILNSPIFDRWELFGEPLLDARAAATCVSPSSMADRASIFMVAKTPASSRYMHAVTSVGGALLLRPAHGARILVDGFDLASALTTIDAARLALAGLGQEAGPDTRAEGSNTTSSAANTSHANDEYTKDLARMAVSALAQSPGHPWPCEAGSLRAALEQLANGPLLPGEESFPHHNISSSSVWGSRLANISALRGLCSRTQGAAVDPASTHGSGGNVGAEFSSSSNSSSGSDSNSGSGNGTFEYVTDSDHFIGLGRNSNDLDLSPAGPGHHLVVAASAGTADDATMAIEVEVMHVISATAAAVQRAAEESQRLANTCKIVVVWAEHAHQGNLGGASGADKICQDDADKYGFTRANGYTRWHAHLCFENIAARSDLLNYVPEHMQNNPVYNAKGWRENTIITHGGTIPYAQWLRSKQGKMINDASPRSFANRQVDEGTAVNGPQWNDADGWHGCDARGVIKRGLNCKDWTSTSGTGSNTELDHGENFLLRQEAQDCSNHFAVPCIALRCQ